MIYECSCANPKYTKPTLKVSSLNSTSNLSCEEISHFTIAMTVKYYKHRDPVRKYINKKINDNFNCFKFAMKSVSLIPFKFMYQSFGNLIDPHVPLADTILVVIVMTWPILPG